MSLLDWALIFIGLAFVGGITNVIKYELDRAALKKEQKEQKQFRDEQREQFRKNHS